MRASLAMSWATKREVERLFQSLVEGAVFIEVHCHVSSAHNGEIKERGESSKVFGISR